MRKFFILMIIATLALGLFLTGCENITEPEDAKWSVMAIAGPEGKYRVSSEIANSITFVANRRL